MINTSQAVVCGLLTGALLTFGHLCVADANANIKLCVDAVSSGQIYIEAKQQIALQRRNSGDLSNAAYAVQLHTLDTLSQGLTLDGCMARVGEQLTFYQCLVAQSGNVRECVN